MAQQPVLSYRIVLMKENAQLDVPLEQEVSPSGRALTGQIGSETHSTAGQSLMRREESAAEGNHRSEQQSSTITVAELKELLEAPGDAPLVLIDASWHSPGESADGSDPNTSLNHFMGCRIPGAVFFDHDEVRPKSETSPSNPIHPIKYHPHSIPSNPLPSPPQVCNMNFLNPPTRCVI